MKDDLLIPFGLHKDTHEIVEPEDAKRGRKCNCICPGCKAPLLSRHPNDGRRIHFAHDTRHKEAKPKEECPFNSGLAVAMMARSLAKSIVGEELKTPSCEIDVRFDCCNSIATVCVAYESMITVDTADSGVDVRGIVFDLKISHRGHNIYVCLVYKGRGINWPEHTQVIANGDAVLKLDCDSFSTGYLKSNKDVKFSVAVMDFLLLSGRREWLVHPRAQRLTDERKKEHRCKRRNQPSTCNKCSFEWAYNPADKAQCPMCLSTNISFNVGVTLPL